MNANFKLEKRDILALLLIPIMLIIDYFIDQPLTYYPAIKSMLSLILYISAISIIFALYKDLFIGSWKDYRKKLWMKIIISILGTLVMYLILFSVNQLMPSVTSTDVEINSGVIIHPVIKFFLSFIPLLIPFMEEIIFRHVLFYKFKENKYLLVLFFIISAFLFGAVHINNFGGDLLLTLPYMVVGAFLSLVYLFTKNIWYSIGMHFVFNFINSTLAGIAFIIMKIFIN